MIIFLCTFAQIINRKPRNYMIKTLRTILLTVQFFFFMIPSSAEEIRHEFFTVNASRGLSDNSVQEIVCTKTGRMMITTLGNLNFYDGSTFNHIDTKQSYRMLLPAYHGSDKLEFDSIHHLWIKNEGGVTCVDLLNEVFIEEPEAIIRSLGCKVVLQDLFTDERGGLWFLTEDGLYNAFDDQQIFQPLRDRALQEVDVFEKLLVTFYDNGEVIAYDTKSGQLVQHSKAYDWDKALRYNQTMNMLRYADGYFMIKTGEQGSVLLQYDVRKQSWKILLESTDRYNDLTVSGDKVFIATDEGYLIFDLKTGEQQHALTQKLAKGSSMKTKCNAIAFDKQGGLWIGTEYRGVLYARPRPSPFKTYRLGTPEAEEYMSKMSGIAQNITEFNGIRANCMFKDSRNWTWVGTMAGLYLYRSPKDEPVVFKKNSGFLNNGIHSVIEDKNKNIWVGTSYGLSCILFKGEDILFINNFSRSDNVPDEMFVNCKAFRAEDEHIVMQTIEHIIVFHPDDFKFVNTPYPYEMYPKLIKLLVNGIEVKSHQEYDGNVIIDRAITRAKDIYLNADQNSISLTFASLNYFRPTQTYYRARIKGIDDDWKVYSHFNSAGLVDNGGRLHLPMMRLEPGDYEVEIQASMFPNVWEEGKQYIWHVHVNQPWWQRSGVYFLFVSLLFILLVVNFIFYNRNTRMRVRRNAEEGDMIRKIISFIRQCDACDSEILAPVDEELFGNRHQNSSKLTPKFIEVMLRLIPYVHHKNNRVTMRQLSEAGEISIVEFYDLMTTNLYKSPRELICAFRIEKGAELLRTTDKSVAEISSDCGFYTENYFMGSFFHRFKLTPAEYRQEVKGEL